MSTVLMSKYARDRTKAPGDNGFIALVLHDLLVIGWFVPIGLGLGLAVVLDPDLIALWAQLG